MVSIRDLVCSSHLLFASTKSILSFAVVLLMQFAHMLFLALLQVSVMVQEHKEEVGRLNEYISGSY